MAWFALAAVTMLLLVVGFSIWRRWIEPWKEADELTRALVAGQAPRKFLITANRHAHAIGLALENFSITRRELEERVHEGETSVHAVFGAMLDGLAVVDEKRRVRMVNREFERVFAVENFSKDTPLLELIRHASVDRVVAEAIRAGEPQRESIQLSLGPAEGRELEVSAVPLRENSARLQGAVVLFRDVTQLRQVEEVRRDFVANVSHELRTPLSIFRGYLETLLDDPQQPPGELLRILEVMERHSDRLNALVEDVLTLARLESPEAHLDLTELDLREFLGAILRDWEKRFAARELQARLELPNEQLTVEADENRLQEVIYNLLDNAVKYSRAGGTITLAGAREGEQVRLSVSDAGVGIREKDLPRVFERFFRADRARSRELGGTGLGLSIVKHIVQLHGGTVDAQSVFGRGATISVVLPNKSSYATSFATNSEPLST